MHAYLIITQNKSEIDNEILKLSQKLKTSTMEFPIAKIDDVRSLNSFLKLTINKPTAIILKNIQEATTEALNAFLKNLEEPQENIFYILTATSIHKVLPTIASRCQIIKAKSGKPKAESENKDVEKFLKMPTGQKLAFVDLIKGREEAIQFTSGVIYNLHSQLVNKPNNYLQTAENLKQSIQALDRLSANGNVAIQLTNMVIHLS